MSDDPTAALLEALRTALTASTLVKLTLSKPRRRGDVPQQAHGRRVELRSGPHLSLLMRHPTRDLTVNHALPAAGDAVAELLVTTFENAHLFTTTGDLELRTNKKGVARLSRHAATFTEPPSEEHDRVKRYVLDPASAPYLQALGIVTPEGHIRSDKADKYRQLQSIVKILDEVVGRTSLAARARQSGARLRVLDMGCGKGYLTFALHHYFNLHLGLPADVIGVDRNDTLMALCNGIAERLQMTGLSFETSGVEDYDVGPVDVLVALHACDTATDVALYKAVEGRAEVVMVVPCCQKELRPQLRAPADELPWLKHDTFKDRHAQMLTDAMRGLLLETQGYQARVFEFISDAHTHRNVMIVAARGPGVNASRRWTEVAALKARYQIRDQRLEQLLIAREPAAAVDPGP